MNNLNDILKDRIISEINTDENTVVIHLKPKEKPLPTFWEEFCALNPLNSKECFITSDSSIDLAHVLKGYNARRTRSDKNLLPNFETAKAVLALCQLIQLRNCYNGDWVPDWENYDEKYVIEFSEGKIKADCRIIFASSPLYFKTKELRNEFLRNFRPLIEKLKPLYGIKEGDVK